jgi:hypothetical protein
MNTLKTSLKWFVVIAVLAYVGWIVFPVAKGLVFPETYEPSVPTMAQDDIGPEVGRSVPPIYYEAPIQSESIQGQTAMWAIMTDNLPVIGLWVAVVLLYLSAAFLHANGNVRAAFAYFIGFVADFVLTYITKGQAGSGILEKLLDVLSGWDPRYVLTLVALLMGFLIVMSTQAKRKKFLLA